MSCKWVILGVLVFALFACPKAEAVSVSAERAVLIEKKTGEIIFEKNAFEKSGMASTTKIMTAIIALEQGNLEDLVTVSPQAAYEEGSSMYLKSGEKVKLESLVYGLMLVSGNDAATAIAEHIARDKKSFAKLMTQKAREIGANNTSFENPHGLDSKNHYTTAYDLALIMRYAMANKTFQEITASKNKVVDRESMGRQVLVNHNKLLRSYSPTTGGKTGFTKKVGRCLVTSAAKDNVELIAVTLNASNDWEDHKNMFDLGFSLYENKQIVSKGEPVATVKIKHGILGSVNLYAKEDIDIPVKKDGSSKFEMKTDVPDIIRAPVYPEGAYGRISVFVNGKPAGETELVAGEFVANVKSATVGKNFIKILTNWLMLFADKDII